MTIQQPLEFNTIFPYPKTHGLELDQGVPIRLCLINLYFKFHLNPLKKSKVIGPPNRVPSLGSNGGEGK